METTIAIHNMLIGAFVLNLLLAMTVAGILGRKLRYFLLKKRNSKAKITAIMATMKTQNGQ